MELSRYQAGYKLETNHWWYLGRRKIIEKLIDKIVQPKEKLKILDVGCGSGGNIKFLQKFGKVIGVDNSKMAISFCRRNNLKNVLLGDAVRLPFNKNSFDLITSLDLLEHVKDDQKALKEFNRVLKPGGHLLITVPALKILWSDFDIPSKHYRRYEKKELKIKIKNVGFKITKLSFINFFLFLPIFLIRSAQNTLQKWIKFGRELKEQNRIINFVLKQIFSSEVLLIEKFDLPIGVSLICIAQKNNENI